MAANRRFRPARRRSPSPPIRGTCSPDLAHQAIDATTIHAQGSVPTAAQVQDIVNFEMALTTALGHDYAAGPLNSSGATGGPVGIASLPFYIGINATGEVKTTTDPGRALVTGLWADVGKTKGPILRGLAGRTPYFHNGSALTLNDVITFYNKRFNIGFTQQNQQDLVAFLSSL
jgi:hypothetical protein